MLSYSMKRKVAFLLVFCIVFLNAPSLEVFAFGYKYADGTEEEPITGLSVGDILESNKTYIIKNSFKFSYNEIYHGKTTFGDNGTTGTPSSLRDIINVYDDTVKGFDGSDLLESADALILEYNSTSTVREYDYSKFTPVRNSGMWFQYTGDKKYPYYYYDNQKTDKVINNVDGTFTFTLDTTMKDTDYIITAMVPEVSGVSDGIKSYNYRIVLEPVPAGTVFKKEMKVGDVFEGGKTYAFLLIQNSNNNQSNLNGYDLHKVYGVAPNSKMQYQTYGVDTIDFLFDVNSPLTYNDVPLYSNDVFTSLDGGENLYSAFQNASYTLTSVIPIMVYITFPDDGTYEFRDNASVEIKTEATLRPGSTAGSDTDYRTFNTYTYKYSFTYEPAPEHVCEEDAPIKENIREATCTTEGSYDLVYYCKDPTCRKEIRKTSHTTEALGHIFDEPRLTYHVITDINDSNTYGELTSHNNSIVDKQSLIDNAYNKDTIKDAVTEDKIVSYALCARAQDAYVLKVKSQLDNPVISIGVGEHHWGSITEDVDFNIFFNSVKDVTLSAKAYDADVVNVAYYISDKKEDTASVTGWSVIPYGNDSVLSVNQIDTYGKHVIYAKVTDTNGNVGYASSNGIVFDNIPPEFKDVKNNDEISAESIMFSVYDEYLSQVWIDGKEIAPLDDTNYTHTIANDESTHTLRAIDKAGNESTVSFVFKTQDSSDTPNNSGTPSNGSNQPSDPPSVPTIVNIIPQTGLSRWPIWVLSLFGLACIIVSVCVYQKHKDSQDRS